MLASLTATSIPHTGSTPALAEIATGTVVGPVTPPQRNDLGEDRYCDLLGGLGADFEPRRGVQLSKLLRR
jgi:hypothetical protein